MDGRCLNRKINAIELRRLQTLKFHKYLQSLYYLTKLASQFITIKERLKYDYVPMKVKINN